MQPRNLQLRNPLPATRQPTMAYNLATCNIATCTPCGTIDRNIT